MEANKPTKKVLALAARIHVLAMGFHLDNTTPKDDSQNIAGVAKGWAMKRLRYMGIDPKELTKPDDCLAKAQEIINAKETAAKFRVG